MGSFVYNCPHCGTLGAGFSQKAEFSCAKGRIAVAATCNLCLEPVTAVVSKLGGIKPSEYSGDILKNNNFFILNDFYPSPAAKDTPEGVPQPVARAYDQAAASRRGGHFDAACGMYRKAMELSLKAFSPEIDAWKIEKRIDKMAAQHKITPELQAWAHELRLDGNDAMHGDEQATDEMADQMHELCRFLFIYLYSLPLQVVAAKERRDAR
mgnify:FL=1